jgi:peptidoglycan/LPS O-acetylase OafA/YrhL
MAVALPVFEFLVATLGAMLSIALLARSDSTVPEFYVWLGVLSYPLYASHMAVVRVAQAWDIRSHNALWVVPMVIAALMLATLVKRAVVLVGQFKRLPLLHWDRLRTRQASAAGAE